MQAEPEQPARKPEPPSRKTADGEPDFDRPLKNISELLTVPDFPQSALGEHVDIGGYTGVVVDIVRQSLKVRSREGTTKSFNANGLRRIYGPPIRPEPFHEEIPDPVAAAPVVAAPNPAAPALPPPPAQLEPDFTRPVKKIEDLVSQPDYPQSLLSEHIQIADYTGVVVQIVMRSLKVRSSAGATRSYNADALKKLYGT